MNPTRFSYSPFSVRAASRRRGVLTLGLVLCMVIILALAGVLWNYQYMVYVNRDIANTAELTMDAMAGPYRNTYATALGKAQLDYAVVMFNDGNGVGALWSGANDVGPFAFAGVTDIEDEFYLAATSPLLAMADIVVENSKPNGDRIYTAPKTGETNPRTISIMVNGREDGASNVAHAMTLTTRTGGNWQTTVKDTGNVEPVFTQTGGDYLEFNERLTSRLNFYRYHTLGFFTGIFQHEKTEPLADGSYNTLEEEVKGDQDYAEGYVALNPYVTAITSGTMRTHDGDLIETPGIALDLTIFATGAADFLEKFYPDNNSASTTLRLTYTRQWTLRRTITGIYPNQTNTVSIVASTDLPASGYVSGVVTGNTGAVAIYTGVSNTTLQSTTTATAVDYEHFANQLGSLDTDDLVCFPVVRYVGGANPYQVVDFIVFRVSDRSDPDLNPNPNNLTPQPGSENNDRSYPETSGYIDLIPTCVVTNGITCDMNSRISSINAVITADATAADAFNSVRCNTSMSKVMVSETPIDWTATY